MPRFGRVRFFWVILFLCTSVLTDGGMGRSFARKQPVTSAHLHWALVWHDEFNGRTGTPVNPKYWTAEVGGSGWGNQELEYYTASTRNAFIDGHGHLAIMVRKGTPVGSSCWYGTCQDTSARLITKGKFQTIYGRIEARIKIPTGIGYWPAFWMLGNNIDQVNWPQCGEIDIMENVGQEPNVVHGSLHGPGADQTMDSSLTAAYYSPDRHPFATGFHTYAVEWEPKAIRWYVDSTLYETVTPADLAPGSTWVFNRPFFLLLNVAMGGTWPGSPIATTKFPQAMLVDYVRVYHRVQ